MSTSGDTRLALLRGEVATAVVALLALVVIGPVAGHDHTGSSSRSMTAGDLVISLALQPNQPGLNSVTVVAASARRPTPAPIEAVSLLVASDIARERWFTLQPVDSGVYVGAVPVAAEGPLAVAVVVRRNAALTAIRLTWTVGSASRGPIPAVQATVLLVLVLAGIAGDMALRRRHT